MVCWLKFAVIFLTLGCGFCGPALAFGRGGSAETVQLQTPSGCKFSLNFDADLGVASLTVVYQSKLRAAGGSVFSFGGAKQEALAISTQLLLSCGYHDVTILAQDGATGDFGSDDYLGIQFSGREAASAPGYQYEWAYLGASKTRLVLLRSLLQADEGAAPGVMLRSSKVAAPQGKTARFDFDFRHWQVPWQVLLLVGLVCTIVLLLYATKAVIELFQGFVQHRRACHIETVLETHDEVFAGKLIVIGLNGCRFQPENKSTEMLLLARLSRKSFSDFDIKIGNTRYPVFVDGFHGYFSACYFYENITRAELRDLLKLSTVAPALVAHIGLATTRKQWKLAIAKREGMLRSKREARPYPAHAGKP